MTLPDYARSLTPVETGFFISVACLISLTALYFACLFRLKRYQGPKQALSEDLLVMLRATQVSAMIAASVYPSLSWLPLSSSAKVLMTRACLGVVLLQICLWGNKGISFWADRYVRKESFTDPSDTSTVGLLSFSAKSLFYSVVFLSTLHALGYSVTALIAGLGLGGVALALAVQSILVDLFACFTIKLDKPYAAGDFIVINDYMGTIEHVGLKTTRIRSLSGEQLIFSNADLLHSRVRNYKRMTERRVSLFLSVPFHTPESTLEQIPLRIQEIVSRLPTTRFERCHFLRFGTCSFDFELVYWVQNPAYLVHAELAQKINLAIVHYFNQENIQFAYPARTVYPGNVSSVPPGPTSAFRPYGEPPQV